MAGRNYNPPPPSQPPDTDYYDPEAMSGVAPFINGCATASHAGSLEGIDTSAWPVGGLIWNADGMRQMEVWDGYCPAPLEGAFKGMTVTLPDGSKVRVAAIDPESCKPVWEAIPPAPGLTPKAILAAMTAALNDPACADERAAFCEALPVTAEQVTPAARAKAKG